MSSHCGCRLIFFAFLWMNIVWFICTVLLFIFFPFVFKNAFIAFNLLGITRFSSWVPNLFYFTIISSAISCCITLQIRDTAIFINQRLIVSTIFLHMSIKCLTASMIFTKSIFWLCIWSFFIVLNLEQLSLVLCKNSTSAFQSVALVERIFFFLSNHRPFAPMAIIVSDAV